MGKQSARFGKCNTYLRGVEVPAVRGAVFRDYLRGAHHVRRFCDFFRVDGFLRVPVSRVRVRGGRRGVRGSADFVLYGLEQPFQFSGVDQGIGVAHHLQQMVTRRFAGDVEQGKVG